MKDKVGVIPLLAIVPGTITSYMWSLRCACFTKISSRDSNDECDEQASTQCSFLCADHAKLGTTWCRWCASLSTQVRKYTINWKSCSLILLLIKSFTCLQMEIRIWRLQVVRGNTRHITIGWRSLWSQERIAEAFSDRQCARRNFGMHWQNWVNRLQ